MSDLNVMMREQARAGLQTQLDAAVTNGDVEAARKLTADIEKLAVQTAPKAPPFGDAEVRAELDKQEWFGIDPKKSAKVIEYGKMMDPKKFGTAQAFAAAIIKAVEDDFKPTPKDEEPPENETEEEKAARLAAEAEETEEEKAARLAAKKPPRKTDGPGDMGVRNTSRSNSGPWLKLSDAPAATQTEIKRSADKFVRQNAPKEEREKFITKALESHYAIHQRNKGKKS